MDRRTFIKIFEEASDKLEFRDSLVQAALENPSLISVLLKNMITNEDEKSNFSARIFELACKKDLEIIIPYLTDFCNLLSLVKLNGNVRSCAKLCELLMIEYFKRHNPKFINTIREEHFEKIIEASFSWMITDQKIAVQAYTMQTLYLLGIKYEWIHNELALIIEKNIPSGSTGYKNRGRKVLKAIETNSYLKL